MNVNAVPHYDDSVNTTGCCARFNPEGWDGQDIHFRDKRVVHATTRSAMHIPLDMGHVFARVHKHIEDSGGWDTGNTVVLSADASPWKADHYFTVSHDVPGEEMTTLSGDFVTRVFEGPYRDAKDWDAELRTLSRARGRADGRVFFFYTTCPKCAKAYGRNYVVGFAEV